MPRDVYELQEIGVVALLKQGKPKDAACTFVFLKDDVELERKTGEISTDGRTGKAATTKYTPPAVADDKPSYKLTFFVIVDGEEFHNADEIMVWPQKGKLKSIKDESTEANLPGFKFKVMQGGAQFGPPYKTKPDTSDIEFKLQKGTAWTIEAIEPWEKKSQEAVKLRDLKAKVVLNFTAEFVKPVRPSSGEIKQWVNLDTDGKEGQDGLGPKVTIQIGAQGDSTRATGEKIGAAGVFAYVNVKFSAAIAEGAQKKKSKRNSPKTELLAGKNLSDLVAVTDGVEYTGKVELAATGGVGEFEVSLGKAGLDKCVVKIGSKPTCVDSTLTFVNWRRIWYETMAPDFVALQPNGDFPTGGVANIALSGKKTGIEYVFWKAHPFTESEANTTNPGSVFRRDFFAGRTDGLPAKVYILTDYTFGNNPKTWDNTKGKRAGLAKVCNFNMYNDGPVKMPDVTLATNPSSGLAHATAATVAFDLPGRWCPVSAYANGGGAKTVKEITWTAVIDPNAIKARPTVEVEADVEASGQDRALLKITEKNQNLTQDVSYTTTALPGSEQTKFDNWIPTIATYAAMKTHQNKLKFAVTVPKNKPTCELAADVERSGQGRAVLRVRETTQNTHTDLSFDGGAVPQGERQKLDDLILRVCTPDLMRGQANKVKFEVGIPKNKPAQTVVEIDGPRGDESKTATIKITETNRNKTHDVLFEKDGFHVGQAVTPGEATKIETFVTELCRADNLKGAGNKIDITIAGPTDNDRRTRRRAAVKTAVEQKLAALATEVAYHPGLAAVKNDIPARVTAVAPEIAFHPGLAALKSALTSRVAAVGPEQAFHPGLDDTGVARTGTLTDPGDKVDLTTSTWEKIVLTLPSTNATDPGSFVGAASATKCPVQVTVKYEPANSGLGLAKDGVILMVQRGTGAVCASDTFLHEFGHQAGLTNYNVATDGFAPGLRKPKSTAETEDVAEYKTNGTKGQYYDGHDHSGSHCAWGLSNTQKNGTSYAGQPGTCIMFGESASSDSQRTTIGFCQQCEDHLRARDLSFP